ncbi:hypothetical protein MK805_12785 [Shimazuella sp. AN120528]|nr:hypothetical protein [Shimazuella soli]
MFTKKYLYFVFVVGMIITSISACSPVKFDQPVVHEQQEELIKEGKGTDVTQQEIEANKDNSILDVFRELKKEIFQGSNRERLGCDGFFDLFTTCP